MGALSAALVPPVKPGKLADLDAFYTKVKQSLSLLQVVQQAVASGQAAGVP